MENEEVKVIVAHEKPRVPTPLHQHKVNRVMIYLQAGSQQILDVHQKPTMNEFKAGEVKWSPRGGEHVAELYSVDPVTIVEVELKKVGAPDTFKPGPLDPVKVDPKHYKIEFENDQVRVLRVKIGPHEATPVHQHSVNRVVTYLTDQDFRVTSADGKTEHSQHKAGEVSWGGPAKHKEENLSDKPFEVVVTELKM